MEAEEEEAAGGTVHGGDIFGEFGQVKPKKAKGKEKKQRYWEEGKPNYG